jgi:hypothetical protein
MIDNEFDNQEEEVREYTREEEEEEERLDLIDVRAALEEAERDGYIAWEDVKRELGLS